jgi:NAD(P)-dependent dehydrogenase (short-subunit alcohol dehydrogenase family)
MQIKDHCFLVVGGSSGLGAACVRRFIDNAANVIIADVAKYGEQLADELGERAVFVKTDVTSEDDVRNAIRVAQDRFGSIAGAAICAGVIYGAKIVGRNGPCDLNEFRRVIDVNLVGTFNVLRLTADAMYRNSPNDDGERGVIVTTSSIAAFEGQIGQAAYSASKGGVAALTLPAARELAKHGIRVVSIAPGVFNTPMMQQVSDEYRDSLLQYVEFPNRFGHPDEFAQLVQQIIENPMLNAAVIRLDGGLRMPRQ